MAQRLEKKTLARACWITDSLYYSTEEVTLQEKDILSWLSNKLDEQDRLLLEADREGKLTSKEKKALFFEGKHSRVLVQMYLLVEALGEAHPVLRRLAEMDLFRKGEGFSVIRNNGGLHENILNS